MKTLNFLILVLTLILVFLGFKVYQQLTTHNYWCTVFVVGSNNYQSAKVEGSFSSTELDKLISTKINGYVELLDYNISNFKRTNKGWYVGVVDKQKDVLAGSAYCYKI